MKLTLNTTDKIISIEGNINIGELITELKKLFPNDEWQTYKLESQSIINWQPNQLIAQPYIYPVWPNYNPFYYQKPFETFCGTTVSAPNGICQTAYGTTDGMNNVN